MQTKKQCYFCAQNITNIDYFVRRQEKDADTLRRFITPQAKIIRRKRTGTCAKHQRQLTKAIKRARHLALLPFVSQ